MYKDTKAVRFYLCSETLKLRNGIITYIIKEYFNKNSIKLSIPTFKFKILF